MVDTSFEEWVARKYISIKTRAEQKGQEFELSLSDMRNLCRVKTCAYTGVTLTHNSNVSEQLPTAHSVDRIDNTNGYIKGNVLVCSVAANGAKGRIEQAMKEYDISVEALKKMCERMENV